MFPDQPSLLVHCIWQSQICIYYTLSGDLKASCYAKIIHQWRQFLRERKEYVSSVLALLGRPCWIYHLNLLHWLKPLQLSLSSCLRSDWQCISNNFTKHSSESLRAYVKWSFFFFALTIFQYVLLKSKRYLSRCEVLLDGAVPGNQCLLRSAC